MEKITYHDLVADVRREIYNLLGDSTLYALMRSSRFLRVDILPYLRSKKVTVTSINDDVGKCGYNSLFRWLRDKNPWNFMLDIAFFAALARSQHKLLDQIQVNNSPSTTVRITTGGKYKGGVTIDDTEIAINCGRSLDPSIIIKYYGLLNTTTYTTERQSPFWIILRNITVRDAVDVFKFFFPAECFETHTNRYGEPVNIIYGDSRDDVRKDRFSMNCYNVTGSHLGNILKWVFIDGAIEILKYLLEMKFVSHSVSVIRRSLLDIHACYHPNMHRIFSMLLHQCGAYVIDTLVGDTPDKLDAILIQMNPYLLKLWSVTSLAVNIDHPVGRNGEGRWMALPWKLVQLDQDIHRRCTDTLYMTLCETDEDRLDLKQYGRPTFQYRMAAYREFFRLIRTISSVFEGLFTRQTIDSDIIIVAGYDLECTGHLIDEGIKRGWIDGSPGGIYWDILHRFSPLRSRPLLYPAEDNTVTNSSIDARLQMYIDWCKTREVVFRDPPSRR